MVTTITGMTRSGVKDWFLQRLSAVVIFLYLAFLLVFLMTHSPLEFQVWQTLYACTAMRLFTLLTLLSVFVHAKIGMWTIFTDYVKCAVLRAVLQVALWVVLFFYVLWGIQIVWGLG